MQGGEGGASAPTFDGNQGTAYKRRLVVRVKAHQAGIRRCRSAHRDPGGYFVLAHRHLGDGLGGRGAPGHEDMAGALDGSGGAWLLHAGRRPVARCPQQCAERAFGDLDRWRGCPPLHTRVAHEILRPVCRHRHCVVDDDVAGRRPCAQRIAASAVNALEDVDVNEILFRPTKQPI